MTLAPKTTAGEVQHHKFRHDHTDDGEEDLESSGEAVVGHLSTNRHLIDRVFE